MERTPPTQYNRIELDQVRLGVRWDTPAQNQGQAIEVSYAHANIKLRAAADWGDDFRRIIDHSLPHGHAERVQYFVRSDVLPWQWAVIDVTTSKILVLRKRRAEAETYVQTHQRHTRQPIAAFQVAGGAAVGDKTSFNLNR